MKQKSRGREPATPSAPVGPAACSIQRSRLPVWVVLGAPMLVAVTVRVIANLELAASLPFYASAAPGFDQHTYDTWAREIAAGDWLSRGQGLFYYAPLYPYMLAAVYMVAGAGNIAAGVAMNVILGVAACGLAADLARRLFSPVGGLAAGLLLAVNGSQVAYEGLLLLDSVMTFLALAGLWGMVVLLERDAARPPSDHSTVWLLLWALAGCPLGLLIAGRVSNVLPVLGLILWMVWLLRVELRRPFYRVALGLFLLSVLFPVACIVVRNRAVGGEWTVTTNGPVNFYLGNAPGASGTFDYPPGYAAAAAEINALPPEKRNAAWKARLRSELGAHPGALRGNLIQKTLLFFNSWDAPDNVNTYFLRDRLASHRLLLTPRLLYALGAMGMALTLASWRRLMPLYLFSLLFAVSLIVVFVSGRYKLPFLAVLALFSGAAVERALVLATARRWPLLAVMAVAAAVCWFAFAPRVTRPEYYNGLLRPNEFLLNARALSEAGRNAEAAEILARGVELFPKVPAFLEQPAQALFNKGDHNGVLRITTPALDSGVASLPLAEMHVLALHKLNRHQEANAWARRLAPHFPQSALLRQAAATP